MLFQKIKKNDTTIQHPHAGTSPRTRTCTARIAGTKTESGVARARHTHEVAVAVDAAQVRIARAGANGTRKVLRAARSGRIEIGATNVRTRCYAANTGHKISQGARVTQLEAKCC